MSQQSKLRIASRYSLSKKDRKDLVEKVHRELGEKFGRAVESSGLVEVGKIREGDIESVYFLDGVPAILGHRVHGLIPSLYYIYRVGITPELPSVYVDAGAVPRILNGADVMAPGVRRVEGDFGAGGKVMVRELEKSRVIAIGVALVNSADIPGMTKGKVISNVHFVGDKYWSLSL